MGRLHELHDQTGQSPWLDNLRRGWIRSGELERWVERGVRGITSNPSIFQKAISGSADYDEQFGDLVGGGSSVLDAYWGLVTADIRDALRIMRPVHDASGGTDGFVSLELDPGLARDAEASITAARELRQVLDEPNLFVKVPATAAGLPVITALIADGMSVNVTLIFSLERYGQVMEAYLAGLEQAGPGVDVAAVRSVASFFVSRTDVEVDRRLDELGTAEAADLKGQAAVAQAQVAYQRFQQTFQGPRWEALAARGAKVQRPLWASTSTKDPAYPDTLYVDTLIGPDTVNTMPEATLEAFDDHGTVARTVDADPEGAQAVLDRVGGVVDLEDVSRVLEDEGVAAFEKSFGELLDALAAKAVAAGAPGGVG